MSKVKVEKATLIGLSLPTQTTNQNNQSATDCGNLWQQFETGNYLDRIPNKLSSDIYAVYHTYDSDYTQPYSYFIGCKVNPGTEIPKGLATISLSEGTYLKIEAQGTMPDCVANAWKEIWKTDIPRAYTTDFEVYDERSKDWSNAEVDIYLSVKE